MTRRRSGRPNRKGRRETEAFIRLSRGVTDSPAWRSLSCEARCLVLLIWGRHNGENNGRIPLSYREARAALHVGNRRVQQAFHEAQDAGFIVLRKLSSFDWKNGAGKGEAREWEVTTERCGGMPAKRLYKKQKPAPGWEPNGSDSGNRLPQKARPKSPNGSDSGNRFGQIRLVSGS